VQASLQNGRPYALAFVDMRMPPGLDGVETVEGLWKEDPQLQIVLCTAYSDYSWTEVLSRLDVRDRLLILKKPFDPIEAYQFANGLTVKWNASRQASFKMDILEQAVDERTRQLKSEMQERERIAAELRLAQKLESVGRLAAGIAHEINTPIQYVGDSVSFLQSADADLRSLRVGYQHAIQRLVAQEPIESVLSDIQQMEATADLHFLVAEIPKAFERTLEGVERVAAIVRAMKEFAHPDGAQHELTDLNRAIETTLTVARNEYKYCAQVETRFGELPLVRCNVGELNQVFLNLLVNAAHAVAESQKDITSGRITIVSAAANGEVSISVTDNGCGIAPENLEKIFDPFFTTKPVGRGTGQGLAIARCIVVDKHRGRIDVHSEVGVGTTFTLRVPVGDKAPEALS